MTYSNMKNPPFDLLVWGSIGTVAETAQARMHGTFLFVRAATDRPSTAGCWQTVQTYMPG